MNHESHAAIAAETFRELARLFDDRTEAQRFVNDLIKIYNESGLEAVQQLTRTVAQGDLAAASRHAHKLKGLSRNIGANRVGDLCAELELDAKSDGGAAPAICELVVAEFHIACDELTRTYFRAA